MATEKQKLKRMTALTAIISLVSFIYKCGLGIYSMSLVLIIASLSTLMVFICKVAFVKTVNKSRAAKKKSYLAMTIATLVYSLIFICFIVLKIFDIDISTQKTYEGWLGILLISFMVIMFVLSIIKLRGALEKTDLMVIGLKEITFISALTDLVIIESFAYGVYLTYYETNEVLTRVNDFFPLGVSITMLLGVLIMFIRYSRYKVTK